MKSSILALMALGLLSGTPRAIAKEVCIPLMLVGGQGSEVSKTVSQPTIPSPLPGIDITKDNWNTDWAVPTLNRFDSFKATITSAEGGTFNIQFYIKYNNQTADKVYDQQGVTINPGTPLVIVGIPDPNEDPYQVNLFNGGLDRIGNSYTATVVACRKS